MVYYNYNGDDMKNKKSLILKVSNEFDLDKLDGVSYINLDIDNPCVEAVSFLKDTGENYKYSYSLDGFDGYVYVDYDVFKEGEDIISNLLDGIKKDYSVIEKARYLYVRLGKIMGYDINRDSSKNEDVVGIDITDNIWGALVNGLGNSEIISKIYLYLCARVGIKGNVCKDGDYFVNKLNLDDKVMEVNLFKDISFIQGGFKTRYFGNYNDNLEVDREVLFTNWYSDEFIMDIVNKTGCDSDNFIMDILLRSQNVIGVDKISSYELGIIYKDIFNRYLRGYDIEVNNLYVNGEDKEHFILISYLNKCYGYNYRVNSFVEIDRKELTKNISSNKIGVYLDEELCLDKDFELEVGIAR